MKIFERIKLLIKKLKEKHIFLFIAIIVSFIIAILFLSILVIIQENLFPYYVKLLYLVPPIIVSVIAFVSSYTINNHPKLTSIISFILNFFVIIIIQIFLGVIFLFAIYLFGGTQYNNPKDYNKALNSIDAKYRISHFPSKIPVNAQNIELHQDVSYWWGSEAITLKFSIDKNYIEDELKKYRYISIEQPDNIKHKHDRIMTDNDRINLDNFTIYVINDRDNEKPKEHHFPYHYGIGVNKKTNQIFYYYTCPD